MRNSDWIRGVEYWCLGYTNFAMSGRGGGGGCQQGYYRCFFLVINFPCEIYASWRSGGHHRSPPSSGSHTFPLRNKLPPRDKISPREIYACDACRTSHAVTHHHRPLAWYSTRRSANHLSKQDKTIKRQRLPTTVFHMFPPPLKTSSRAGNLWLPQGFTRCVHKRATLVGNLMLLLCVRNMLAIVKFLVSY